MELIILDLDETLVYATEEPLEYAPNFVVGPYVSTSDPTSTSSWRPSTSSPLSRSGRSTDDYAAEVSAQLPFVSQPVFLWGRRPVCGRSFDDPPRKLQRNLVGAREPSTQSCMVLDVEMLKPSPTTRSRGSWARAAWARCIAPSIPSSTEMWP